MQYALSAHWRQMLQNGWCVRCLFVGSSSIILIWWINITVYRSVFLSFCVSCRPTSERVSKENCVFHGSDGSSYLVKPPFSWREAKPARNFVDVSYFSEKAVCCQTFFSPFHFRVSFAKHCFSACISIVWNALLKSFIQYNNIIVIISYKVHSFNFLKAKLFYLT